MTITQTLTPPGTAPARSQPAATFITNADAHVAWQATHVSEMTAWTSQVNAIAAAAVGDVATAIGSAAAATPVGADKICWRQTSSGLLKSATFTDVLAGGTLPGAFTTLSATGSVSLATTGTANSTITIGGAPTLNNSGALKLITSANQYNWEISQGLHTADGVFDITPSTALGGSTFTTPVLTLSTTGLAVTGTISATTTIKTGGYTVATLPAGVTGDRAYITDATTPTYLGALTGGGAVVCPVFKNASAWVSA